jgi:hypothetical protein
MCKNRLNVDRTVSVLVLEQLAIVHKTMDIRPHRRLVVPFTPSYFNSLMDIVDYAAEMYEHFGVAKFDPSILRWGSIETMKGMCDDLGLKLMISTIGSEGMDFTNSAIKAGVDYTIYGNPDVSAPDAFTFPAVYSNALQTVCGICCTIHDMDRAREIVKFCPPDSTLLALGPLNAESAIQAMKGGATMVEVDDSIFRKGKTPRDWIKSIRSFSEDIRSFT